MKNTLLLVPNLKAGGQEKVAVETAKLLKNEGYQVYLCVFDSLGAFYDVSGYNVIDICIPASKSFYKKVANFLRRMHKLYAIKRNLQIQYSYSFGITADLANIFSQYSDQIITSIRGFASTQGFINKRLITPLIVLRSHKVIVVSREMETEIKNHIILGKRKVRTLYNPYPIEEIRRKALAKTDTDMVFQGKIIVAMGRLVPIKGYNHLIRAMKYVVTWDSNTKLVIIGDGPERDNLKQLIKRMDQENHIFLIGNKENPFSYLKQCSLYCLTSYREGFPNSLVEAMICGLPVISVDCKSGPREILGYSFEGNINRAIYMPCGTLIPAFDTPNEEECGREEMLGQEIIKMLKKEHLKEEYELALQDRVRMFSDKGYTDRLISIMEDE